MNMRIKERIFVRLCWIGVFAFLPFFMAVSVSASDGTQPETDSISLLYGLIATVSLLLFLGYCLLEKQKDRKFLLLYGTVFMVNLGYFLLSVSPDLTFALWANRISYLGAAYSVLLMLLIIMDVCRIRVSRNMRICLIAVSTAAFLLAASGGILPLYYREVTLIFKHGASALQKVYGPLHILYSVYLFTYFGGMVCIVVYAIVQKKLMSAFHAVFLASIVLGNIIIWLVEQLIRIDFEFLAVSYMATEIFLLLLWSMLRLYGILDDNEDVWKRTGKESTLPPNLEELYSSFVQRVKSLSAAEKRILDYYIDGYETADIPDLAYVSIHTVKKHNRNIYQKLQISSRDELMLYIDLFRRCGRLDQLIEENE